jgi:hypothetical protein
MRGWRKVGGLVALGLLAAFAGPVRAERTPSMRTPTQKNSWPKSDITVPYTTNGRSAILTGSGVAPKVYSSPIVDDPRAPQAKPVYNLIFYGAVQAFGDKSNGATPKPK